MKCEIVSNGEPFELDLPEEFLSLVKKEDETEVTLARGYFVQEGVVIFVAVRIANLPMVRTRFALAHADLFGDDIEKMWKAQQDSLPTYTQVRDRLSEKLSSLNKPSHLLN